MSDISVQEFDGPDSTWDALVAGFDGGTFCHLAAWSDVFRDGLGHETIRLVAVHGEGETVGLLPLTRMRSLVFGRNAISMPFLNYGGPLGSPEAQRALAGHGVELAREGGCKLLELRSRLDTDLSLPVSSHKVIVLLPLPDDSEALWTGLKAKVRSQVRRPQKAGMRAEFGTDRIPDFYRVFCTNMRDLGTPVLPESLFEAIGAHLETEVMVCAVYLDDEPVAGGVGFLHQEEFEITWASSLRSHSREAPNMLLYWAMMEDAISRGAKVFNFGRCTPDTGSHRFKLQWGGHDAPLYWSRWSPNGGNEPPSADSSVYGTATRIWSRLPLPIANALGPRLSRALPTF